MVMAEVDNDDSEGISCCTAAADECGEVTIWRQHLLPAEAEDDADDVRCCAAAADEC